MLLEIWSDIACPWCWVGKRRLERALADFEHRDELEIAWRSFELDPRAPRRHAEPAPQLLARKYGVPVAQAEAMNANLESEGRKEGLAMRLGDVQVGNTFDAHRLVHLAATLGRREAMVERLFAAYLAEGEAVGEPAVLERLATEVGLGAERVRALLAGDDFADAVRADERRAQAFGITGVPFFAIDERVGVSGAQPPAVLLEVLRESWAERDVAVPAAEGCDDESCVVPGEGAGTGERPS
jgi:predicted DsbA family dithiol-disulfide isomerase